MFYDGQKYRELLDGDQKRVGIRIFNGKIASEGHPLGFYVI